MQRGCACSFLYGPDTSELVRQQIRKALDEHKEFKAELILYRKSGEAPWYQFASPLVPPWWAGHPPHSWPLFLSHRPIHSLIPFCALPLSCLPSHHPCSSLSPLTPSLEFLVFRRGTEHPISVSGSHVCSPLPPLPSPVLNEPTLLLFPRKLYQLASVMTLGWAQNGRAKLVSFSRASILVSPGCDSHKK